MTSQDDDGMIDRREFVKWTSAAGMVGVAGCAGDDGNGGDSGNGSGDGGDGGDSGNGSSDGGDGGDNGSEGAGTLGDWSVDWDSPEPRYDRLMGDEWIPPEFDDSETANTMEQTNSGGMAQDPATAYGQDITSERAGIDITSVEVPSAQLAPRTTTILASRAEEPALLQVPADFYMDLVQPGFLEPIEEIWNEELYDAFPDVFRDSLTTDLDSTIDGEHLYGSHSYSSGFFLHSRADLLEEMGFESDFLRRPTWSDIREVCEEATNHDFWGYSWVGSGSRDPPKWWIIKTSSRGANIVQDDDTVVVNSEDGVATLEWMVQLIEDELVPNPIQYSDSGNTDLFLQDSLVAYDTGGDLIRTAEEDIGFENYQLGLPPRAEEGPDPQFASWVDVYLIGINRFTTPEKKRAAMVYLDAQLSAEHDTQEWVQEGNFPSNSVSIENIDSPFGDTLNEFQEIATQPVWPQQVQTLNILTEELQQAYGMQKTPQEALDDAQEQIDQILGQA